MHTRIRVERKIVRRGNAIYLETKIIKNGSVRRNVKRIA